MSNGLDNSAIRLSSLAPRIRLRNAASIFGRMRCGRGPAVRFHSAHKRNPRRGELARAPSVASISSRITFGPLLISFRFDDGPRAQRELPPVVRIDGRAQTDLRFECDPDEINKSCITLNRRPSARANYEIFRFSRHTNV